MTSLLVSYSEVTGLVAQDRAVVVAQSLGLDFS